MAGTIDANGNVRLSFAGLKERSLGNVIQHVAADKQFVLLGDSDHSKVELLFEVLEPSTLQGMNQAGIKHICFEYAKEAQNYINAYVNGTLSYEGKTGDEALDALFASPERAFASPEENAKLAAALPEFIRSATRLGIRVHFVDSVEEMHQNELDAAHLPRSAEMREVWDKIANEFLGDAGKVEAYMNEREAKEPGFKNQYMAFESAMLNLRHAQNSRIAGEMEAMAATGKVAIFYGEGHMSRDDGFANMLGDRATFIGLRDSQHDVEVPNVAQRPDYVFYTGLEVNGREMDAVGKIEAPETMSPAQKAAIAATGGLNLLAYVDEEHKWNAAPQTPASAAPAQQRSGPQ